MRDSLGAHIYYMPDTTSYYLAFDAVTDFRPGLYSDELLSALALGVAVILISLIFARNRRQRVPVWLVAACASVPVAVYGLAWALSYREVRELRSAIANGHFTMVAGVVTNLRKGDGHHPESFEVAGHRYEYSSSSRSAAFNRDAAVNGPIHDSLQIRIADVNGQIARLEIAQ